jgi:hypothetical protein
MPSGKHIAVYAIIALIAVSIAYRVPAIGSLVFPAKTA